MDDEPVRAPTTPAPSTLGPDDPPAWVSNAIKQGITWAIAGVLLTLAALWFLGQETTLVRYLITAALLALALEPAVIWAHDKRGWRRGSATGVLLAIVFLLVVLFAVVLASILAKEANQVVDHLPDYVDSLNEFTRDHFDTTVISAQQRSDAVHAAENIRAYVANHMSDVLGGAISVLGAVFEVFTIGLFTFYFTANGPKVRRALLSRLPPEKQERALFAWETAIRQVGGYLYSRLLLAAINGFFMFVTLLIVGSPFALPLAVFEGIVAEFIPIVGTYIAGAVPVVIVLAEVGPTAALIVLIEIVVYQQIENYFLSPKISAETMELNAGIAFAAAFAGGAVGGFIGAFFALPIAATIQAFLSEYSNKYEVVESDLTRVDAPPPEPPKEEKKGLRERFRRKPDEPAAGASDERSETP